MSTFRLNGFRRRDIFVQRSQDEVSFIIDGTDAASAVATAKKLLNGAVCLLDGVEIESGAPDTIKRRVLPSSVVETCTTTVPDTEFMIR